MSQGNGPRRPGDGSPPGAASRPAAPGPTRQAAVTESQRPQQTPEDTGPRHISAPSRRPSQPRPALRPDPTPSSLRSAAVTSGEIVRMLRRRLLTLVVCFVIALAAALALLASAAKEYDGTSVVRVAPVTSAGDTGAAKDISTITEARIVTSTAVAAGASKTLNFHGTLDDLLSHVSVSSPLNSQLLYITYTGGTPREAASGANAFAAAYLDYRRSVGQSNLANQTKLIRAEIVNLQDQLKALPTTPAFSSERNALRAQINSLNDQVSSISTTVVVPGQIVGVAQRPTSPGSPKKILYEGGGVLAGLILGVVAAVVRDRRDDAVHGAADLEGTVGAPVLASIGSPARSTAPAAFAATTIEPALADQFDAYRGLVTKLHSQAAIRGTSSFLIVRGGRTTEASAPMNLAATFARQGTQTVLVTTEPGLRQIESIFDDGKRPAGIEQGLVSMPSVPNLWLLVLGAEADLDRTLAQHGELLDEVFSLADVAVVDGVNLLLASSALALSELSHAAVVVAVDGRTGHAEIETTVRELGQVGVQPVGGVLFRRRRRWLTRQAAGQKTTPSRRRAAAAPTKTAAPTLSADDRATTAAD